jgi:hypothetical protein
MQETNQSKAEIDGSPDLEKLAGAIILFSRSGQPEQGYARAARGTKGEPKLQVSYRDEVIEVYPGVYPVVEEGDKQRVVPKLLQVAIVENTAELIAKELPPEGPIVFAAQEL